MGTRLYAEAEDTILEKILDVPTGSIQDYRLFEQKAKDFKLRGQDSEFADLFPKFVSISGEDRDHSIWLAEDQNPVFRTLSHYFTYGFGKINESQITYIKSNELGDRNAGQTQVTQHMHNLICLHDSTIPMSAETWAGVENIFWC